MVENNFVIKFIERLLNTVFYCIYSASLRLESILDIINPATYLARLPCVKKRQKKVGIDDFESDFKKLRNDKRFGASIKFAGGLLGGLICIFFTSFLPLIDDFLTNIYFVICVVLSMLILYFFIFKNDKYINYFKKYEKIPQSELKKYYFITVLFVVFVLFSYYSILIFLINMNSLPF